MDFQQLSLMKRLPMPMKSLVGRDLRCLSSDAAGERIN
jgi:hypothetical protein